MIWWQAAVLGAIGAGIYDLVEVVDVIRSRNRDVPDEFRTFAFVVATLVRMLAGAAFGGVLGETGQVGPIGAAFVGVLGPIVVERLAFLTESGAS